MSNPINIDETCNRAIRREIGEQLRVYLRVSPRLPARLRKQVDRLYKLEGQSPPSFPKWNTGSKNKPRKDASRGGGSR
jgi:hypothetical protein